MTYIHKVIIYFIVFIFGVNLLLINNGYFFQKINTFRSDLFIDNNDSKVSIIFTLKEWKSIKNNREIFYKNSYYDIKSYKIQNNKIIAKVVPDAFEIKIKRIIKHLLDKKTKKHAQRVLKTKTTFFFLDHFSFFQRKRNLKYAKNKISKKYLSKDYIHFINSDFKPPKHL